MDIELHLRFHDFNELRQILQKLLAQLSTGQQDAAALDSISKQTADLKSKAERISTDPPKKP